MQQTHVKSPNQMGVRGKTPVKVDRLRVHLKNYDKLLSEFLVAGFTDGFHLGLLDHEHMQSHISKNHKSALDHAEIVSEKINKEVAKGRYIGPFNSPPFTNFVCSPLGLVSKKEIGQYRLIHDLSYPRGDSVNTFIPKENATVSYQNIETVIELVQHYGRNCLMAKADIEDAFRNLVINPSDYHLLGLQWEEKFYYDTCLPMGCSSSCQLFEKFSSSLEWILTHEFGIKGVSHLLDDFFFVGNADSQHCNLSLDTFLWLCKDIGVPIKKEKTQRPTNVITIYGIEIDSSSMVARLPKDKIDKIASLLAQFKRKRKVTLRELQSLLGLLNFACSVIIPGRAFLRRLFDLVVGLTCPHYRITLNSESRADLQAWENFITEFNGKSCFLFQNWVSSDSIKLYSDAAGVYGGFAAVFGCRWIAGDWTPDMEPLHITVKELFPIVLALEIWGHLLTNHKLLFLSDNAAVVDIINKTSSKDKCIMKLVRRLVIAALKFNIFFKAKHIPGKSNVICDLLSRFSFQEVRSLAPWLDTNPTDIPPNLLHI